MAQRCRWWWPASHDEVRQQLHVNRWPSSPVLPISSLSNNSANAPSPPPLSQFQCALSFPNSDKLNYTVHTLFLLCINCVFYSCFYCMLVLLYVLCFLVSFGRLFFECSKIFPYKLMATASSLHVILVYEMLYTSGAREICT